MRKREREVQDEAIEEEEERIVANNSRQEGPVLTKEEIEKINEDFGGKPKRKKGRHNKLSKIEE